MPNTADNDIEDVSDPENEDSDPKSNVGQNINGSSSKHNNSKRLDSFVKDCSNRKNIQGVRTKIE